MWNDDNYLIPTDVGVSFMPLWAKKENQSLKWLPLYIHSADAMNVISFLFNHWISSGQKEYIISQCSSSEETESLIRFIGGIHDFGKATPAFQIQRCSNKTFDSMIFRMLEDNGFNDIHCLNLPSRNRTHHSLAGGALLYSYGFNYDICSIVSSHHGKTYGSSHSDTLCYKKNLLSYPSNYYSAEDVNSSAVKHWKKCQKKLFDYVFIMSGLSPYKAVPKISETGQVLITGLLIMADWIASNTDFFPLIDINDDGKKIDLNKRFNEGIKKWQNNKPFSNIHTDLSADEIYKKRFGFFPHPFQKDVFETVRNIKKPGLLIMEMSTGGGKTEASLITAEQFAQKSGKSGLFFGLPTQATSNGIFPRILSWTKSLSQDYGNSSIRLVHGKAALNKDIINLKRSASNIDIDSHDGTVSVNEWFSGRKLTALDDFVVGTVDQFLMMSLKQKHLMLRHLGMSKKVVIIDEVHSYDTYMKQYLKRSLEWAAAYNVPVILISATLSEEARTGLIDSYMKGMGIKSMDRKEKERTLSNNVYPLLTYTDGDDIRQEVLSSASENKKVKIKKTDESSLINVLDDAIRNGGIAGIIVNTVKRAQKIGNECIKKFGSENVEIIHSGFIATDRADKENRLMSEIGKSGNRPNKKIIIGTQVLEQSLDIDFDVLFTDLCPIDMLIQRIGRLHRHDIERPNNLKIPQAYIMGMNENFDFEKGTAYVYDRYILVNTELALQNSDYLYFPDDTAKLISEVYGKDKIICSEKNEEKYNVFYDIYERKQKEEKEKASGFSIESPKLKIDPERYNLIGWLNSSDKSDNEEEAYAQVRDSAETLEIIAVQKTENGYSFFGEEKDISKDIKDSDVAQKLAQCTLRLPASIRYKIKDIIKWLNNYKSENFHEWKNTPWLKGYLGIIFDQNGDFKIGNITLHYSNEYGLIMEEKRSVEESERKCTRRTAMQ